MKILRLNSRGEEVVTLQKLLISKGCSIESDGVFGQATQSAVKEFQLRCGLSADGIVGGDTWSRLQSDMVDDLTSLRLNEDDFARAAQTLGVDVATVKAVQQVESGRGGGFIDPEHPTLLFEGHIFWRELTKEGIVPNEVALGNEDILYPKWTKSHYKGGMGEYTRLEKAIQIHRDAAWRSASWGLFQIMGFNHKACGCESVKSFIDKMHISEGAQLDLFVSFIQNNRLDKPLRERNWAEFARRYNGPAYAENNYDKKLANAYDLAI